MRAHDEQSGGRTVEKMTEDGRWVPTAFTDLRKGEVVRFWEPNGKAPLEQNGATAFIVVSEPCELGDQSNVKISVAPFSRDVKMGAQCPCYGNIIVKPHGEDRLIEATGCCLECQFMRACLKARYSSAYFTQLRGALGLDDICN
jgi:hypothetical protein